MPRTDRKVRRSKLASFLIVAFFLPFFWLMWYGGLMLVLGVVFSIFGEVPNVAKYAEQAFDEVKVFVPGLLSVLAAAILYYDLRRQPVTPDGRYCANCGYDLTGNVTGTCPECGSMI